MAIRRILSHLVKSDPPPLLPSSSSKLASCSLFPAPLLHLHLPPPRPAPFLSPRAPPITSSSSATTHASYSSASHGGTEEHSSAGGWTREGAGGEMEGRRTFEREKISSWTTLDGRRKLRGFTKIKRPYESTSQQEESVSTPPATAGGGIDVLPPPSRPTPPPPPRLQPHPFQARPSLPAPSAPPQPFLIELAILPPTFIPPPPLLELDLKLTTPPSAHPDPVLLSLPPSLETSIASLLSSPSISLKGLGISPKELSLALELLGSQTSSFTTHEMEEDSKLSLDELNELNNRRKDCARMVSKMVESRTTELSSLDEYWVARATLQLGSAVSTIPRSSYSFSVDGSLSLYLPFFQRLLSSTSTRSESFEAVHHFTNLLPRLPSLVPAGSTSLPRQDVLALLDLILERFRTLDDVVPTVDLIIRALTSRRDDQGVSFFIRRILQTFDGSDHSMAVYKKILDLDASSYLGSAAVCQFGLSLSELWDASQVLEDPQLSSRHFHLLAYRMVLSIERSLPSADGGLSTFNVSRLARPFRRMGADLSRPRIPLSVDLRNRIVDLLSRHRDKSVAAWIFLNHSTIPVASSSSSASHNTIIDLEPSSTPNSLPPSPVEFAPLPLPLAEQLLLILCSRRRAECLLLAVTILNSIPPKDQTIKLYNLLLRHTFDTLRRRDEADAFSSALLHSLIIASYSNPSLRPNLQTFEAQLLVPPKSLRRANFKTSEQEHNELASFRGAAFEGFFTLVMERGGEFRRKTWELLVGAVTKECGFEKGREAVEWMRLAGFEPRDETWGEQVLRNGNPWDRGRMPEVRMQEMVIEVMDREGVSNGRHIYSVLLKQVVRSILGTPKNHLRHLFLTDFVARSFPGTSWITLTSISSPSSSPSPPEPTIEISHTTFPALIHVGVTLNLNPDQRPLPPHLLAAPPPAPSLGSSFPFSSSSSSSQYPSMYDLQPPSKWSDWDPPASAGGFSFERDAAPMLSMLMNRFKKDGDEEFAAIMSRCLQEGRTEEMEKRKEAGLEWWEGGWEWEDEWREGKRTRPERRE